MIKMVFLGSKVAKIFWVLMAAVGLFLTACDNRTPGESKAKPLAVNAKETLVLPVEVVTVRRGDITQTIVATATVAPDREAHISSKIAGRLEEIRVREGDRIKKGEIVFKLEQTDLLLALKAAEAQLSIAKASLNEARLNMENISREKDRLNRLFEKNAISQQKNDDINSAYLLAQNKVDLAQAQLRAAETNLAQAKERLEESQVKAPFSGLVFKKMANAGEMIQAGMPIISLMDIDRVKLEVDIAEVNLMLVKKGATATVRVDALGSRVFKGNITRIYPRINPINRTFRMEVEIDNSEYHLKPGMFARLDIKTQTFKNVIIVPLKALIGEDKDAGYVMVAVGNRVEKRPVKLGLFDDRLIEVREGLVPGENIVVAGNYALEEGTVIKPRLIDY